MRTESFSCVRCDEWVEEVDGAPHDCDQTVLMKKEAREKMAIPAVENAPMGNYVNVPAWCGPEVTSVTTTTHAGTNAGIWMSDPRSPYVEPDDQVLSEPICLHPERARIDRKAPWFCVTCGKQAWIGETIEEDTVEDPIAVEMIATASGETEVSRVAGVKKESFLDFLFGGGKA